MVSFTIFGSVRPSYGNFFNSFLYHSVEKHTKSAYSVRRPVLGPLFCLFAVSCFVIVTDVYSWSLFIAEMGFIFIMCCCYGILYVFLCNTYYSCKEQAGAVNACDRKPIIQYSCRLAVSLLTKKIRE